MSTIETIETHISWVLLAGKFAYKIKKPVNMGFLDFTQLAARRHYCEQELRLNRRLAPDLYLDVVPVTGSVAAPRFGGAGPVLEWAVKMRRFEQSALASAKLDAGELDSSTITALARRLADFHAGAADAFQTPGVDAADCLFGPTLDNFAQLLPLIENQAESEPAEHLRQWTLSQHKNQSTLLAQRLITGHVRECHGDLHLANVVILNGQPVPYDCLEFSPVLRWIDTMNEIAFLIMDLTARGRSDLGFRLLNAYLEASGDYDGIAVLSYYLVYRALVRAKIALLHPQQAGKAPDFRRYLELASTYTQPRRSAIAITYGPSGSGKSMLSESPADLLGLIRIRSDVERKRLAGESPLARTNSAPLSGIYSAAATDRVYKHLLKLSSSIVRNGFPVLVDATFASRNHRDEFRRLADQLKVPFAIVSLVAPRETLSIRVAQRAAVGADASEATLEVLDRQLADMEALTRDEADSAIVLDTRGDLETVRLKLRNELEHRLWPCP